MSGEFTKCRRCGEIYEATTDEVASYFCPKCSAPKGKPKILDKVRLKSLTKINRSDDDRTPPNKFESIAEGEDQ